MDLFYRKFELDSKATTNIPLWLFYYSLSVCIFSIIVFCWCLISVLKNVNFCPLPIYIFQTLLFFVLSACCLLFADENEFVSLILWTSVLAPIFIIGAYYFIIKRNILRLK